MTTKRRSKRIKRRTVKRGGRPSRPVMKPLGPKPKPIHAWGDSASKHGGDGSLNDHIVNYVKEFHASEPDQTKLDNHKQLYKNAYIRHYKIKPKRSGVLGFFKKEHPDVEKSFNKRVANEKIRVKEEQELQEEIVRRNLKKDEVNKARQITAKKLSGIDEEEKRKYGDMISIKKEQRRAKKIGELYIDSKNMPSTEARRFVESGRRSSTRGPSKLRGGKRRSRKYKFRKNKRTRRRRKKGSGIGPFGKQKSLSSNNKPKTGDKVRVKGEAGWTVITPMNRSALVCRPNQSIKSEFGIVCNNEEEVSYNDMTKMGFMGQMGFKKGGRRKHHVGKGVGKSKPIKSPSPPPPSKQTRKSVQFSSSTKSASSPKTNKTKKMFISKNKDKQKAVVQYENRQQRQDLLDMSLGRIPLDGGNRVRRGKKSKRR